MKLIIDVDDEMYKRIRNSVSVPDVYGDIAINKIFEGIPYEERPQMTNEDIIKFINDNCRHCSGEGFDDKIDDCHECPLLKKCLFNKNGLY